MRLRDERKGKKGGGKNTAAEPGSGRRSVRDYKGTCEILGCVGGYQRSRGIRKVI